MRSSTLPHPAAGASGAVAGAVNGAGAASGEVLRRISAVHRAIDRLRVTELDDGEHAAALSELERAKRRIEAAMLKVLASAERAELAMREGKTGTGAWAAQNTNNDSDASAAQSRLATDVETTLPETRDSLDEGRISAEHAKVIADTMRQLPEEMSVADRARIEARLVARAKETNPRQLRRAARRALEAVECRRREVDKDEDRQLRGREAIARSLTRLTMHENPDGTTTGRFVVPTFAAKSLRKVIQQIASPRRDYLRDQRDGWVEGGEDGMTQRSGMTRRGGLTRYVDQDWAHRYGLAFVEILEHLPTERLTGKVNATVVVTMSLDELRSGVGVGRLDTGDDLSASEVRRLACNAGIVPAVLGGAALPLDLGRESRFFTEAQRVALATLYECCAMAGCDRPIAWCEVHHETPWVRGGRTDLEHAVPLCGFHHRRMDDPEFGHSITRDAGTGRKVVRLWRREGPMPGRSASDQPGAGRTRR